MDPLDHPLDHPLERRDKALQAYLKLDLPACQHVDQSIRALIVVDDNLKNIATFSPLSPFPEGAIQLVLVDCALLRDAGERFPRTPLDRLNVAGNRDQ